MTKKSFKKITAQQDQDQQKQQAQVQRISEIVSQNLNLSEKQSKKFAAQANALMRNLKLRRAQRTQWQMTIMPEEEDNELIADKENIEE